MCLIHTHHADTILSDAWVENFFSHNSDGIGMMYSEPDENGVKQLVVKKYLPKNAADAIQFYKDNIKGRECVVHWRMATHGDVDLINCHPYEITPLNSPRPLWMMHNGVLSRGNYGDKTKSDTWHFIKDILKPMLDPEQGGNPDLAFHYGFRELVGEAIGNSNRFVFMDADGDVSIVNKATGVEWNYMWMSNTYAWDAPNGLFKRGKGLEARDMSNDHNDVPDDWTNYRGLGRGKSYKEWENEYGTAVYPTKSGTYGTPVGATKGNGTVVTGKVSAGGKKGGKKKNKNALVPVPNAPVERTQSSVFMDQLDEVFNTLDEERKTKAYAALTYQDFAKFVNEYDLDVLWDATYMCADGIISEDNFIDLMHDPKKWSADKPSKIAVGSGDSVIPLANGYVPDEQDMADLQAELQYEQDQINERVIEATMPTHNPYSQLVSDDTARFAEAAARELDQVNTAAH